MSINQNGGTRNPRRTVFVAYPYSLYPKNAYRRLFMSLAKEQHVKFVFADERISNMHILQKITQLITTSNFSLFDISGWNPNVTLELGIALATSQSWYICINPKKTENSDVPSDIRGIDRIQYTSLPHLRQQLRHLVIQVLADGRFRHPADVPRPSPLPDAHPDSPATKPLQDARLIKHKKRKPDGILLANISSDFFNLFPARVQAMVDNLDLPYTPENFGASTWLAVFRRFASEGYFLVPSGTPPQRITMKTLLNPSPKFEPWLHRAALVRRSIAGLED